MVFAFMMILVICTFTIHFRMIQGRTTKWVGHLRDLCLMKWVQVCGMKPVGSGWNPVADSHECSNQLLFGFNEKKKKGVCPVKLLIGAGGVGVELVAYNGSSVNCWANIELP